MPPLSPMLMSPARSARRKAGGQTPSASPAITGGSLFMTEIASLPACWLVSTRLRLSIWSWKPLRKLMDSRPSILIVDDEEAIRSALSTLLLRAGFNVFSASDAHGALDVLHSQPLELVLLDVVLDETNPQSQSGLDILRAIRAFERFIPVIMLTSYTEWQLESLGLGAIAFVTKPWESNALLGQIRATLNAVAQIKRDALHSTEQRPILRIDDLQIDTEHYRVSRAGKEIDLTPLEFALLAFLVRNPNREWTREQLLNQVWGYEWVGYERTVDRHIAAIRRKLKLGRDELIETLHGRGYRLLR
ncbi:MAG: DNA-binding response regulator [Phototrophicales bacterium]|nr:MAG: DNA-binding response regulator [Phototrophicales bacterium]